MTYVVDKTVQKAIDTFRQYDVDTQLALLWYGYLDLKDELHPAPGPSVTAPAQAVYDAICDRPQQEQLQAQRDLLVGTNKDISRQYTALAPNGRLEVWLLLAQGMESGDIIGMPQDYKLPSETDNFTNQVKQLNFEQRVSFMMNSVIRPNGQ